MLVDISHAEVTTPTAVHVATRFVFRDGTTAVWARDPSGNAVQLLFATDATLNRPSSAREPMTVTLSDGTLWSIRRRNGGCGCNKPGKGLPLGPLLTDASTAAIR